MYRRGSAKSTPSQTDMGIKPRWRKHFCPSSSVRGAQATKQSNVRGSPWIASLRYDAGLRRVRETQKEKERAADLAALRFVFVGGSLRRW
jgi:hypothetical protein